MSKHTPGPWTCRKTKPEDLDGYTPAVTHWVDADNALPVADVKLQSASEANARLIAASPDLLAALQVALLQIERMTYEAGRTGIEAAKWGTTAQPPAETDMMAIRAAIAKAE
jgi:hypothetical protein